LRRILSFVLLGLGVFAVALGLLLRLYAYPRLAKIPVDVDTTVNAEGSNVTALMFVKQPSGVTLPEIRTGLNLSVTRKVTGDLTQPEVVKDGNVASWKEGVNVVDSSSGARVSATERQLCLDRRTNESVQPCTNQYVQSKVNAAYQPVREDNTTQPGISLKFPFDTAKRGYQMYDLNLRNSTEAKFDGEDKLNGLDVYRFVQDIPPTKLEVRKVPGSLLGKADPVVDADLFYKNKRTVWVEPVTGQIIKGQEHQLQELRAPGENTGTAVFDGTLTFTEQTVSKNVADATANKSKLALLTTFPVILWIAGTVSIVVAVALLILWRGGRGARRSEPDPPQQRQLADATR
jgi:hypothetical protein